MGLRAYIIRRLLLMIPTLIGVTLLIFAVLQFFSPVERASLYIQSEKGTQESVEFIIKKYHLGDPVYIQYVYWMSAVLTGNLGWAESARMPVLQAIIKSLPATLELVAFSIPITILLGIRLGVTSAVHRDKPIDHLTRILSIVGWSLPTFWLGLLLLAMFFGVLPWFPPMRLDLATESFVNSPAFTRYTGLNTIDALLNGQYWMIPEIVRHLVLPTITLTTISIALIIRVMRSSMLEALGKTYITTARAKGLAKKEVINKHARRNALIPTITIAGMLAAGMMTGVVITETVFTYKGIGYLAAKAAIAVDIPMVLGFALFVGIVFTISNLIVDVMYAYIDPRIRLE